VLPWRERQRKSRPIFSIPRRRFEDAKALPYEHDHTAMWPIAARCTLPSVSATRSHKGAEK